MTMIWLESATGALVVMIFYTMLTGSALISGMFVAINNCTCEGYNQVYECRVTGGGATVWRGSAFDCSASNNEIVLLHSSSSSVRNSCSNGAIVGRVARADNNTYVSHITVSVNAEMVGKNISCFHDSSGINLIGSSLLTLTTDPYLPPDDVYLTEANSGQLLFQWSSVTPSCEAIHYLINVSGSCGHCPDITNTTTVTCHLHGLTSYSDVCTLAVQTVVCDNITGNESRKVIVTLGVPDAPEISVVPAYSYNTKTLSGLTTKFNETETFNISDGVDGSALFYTINYTNSNSSAPCKTDKISASSCVNRSCEHDYKMFPLNCSSSSHVTVTVSGTNILGSGPPSDPVTIPERSDQFVNVSVNLVTKTVTCLFVQPRENSTKNCGIVYSLSRENCKPLNQSRNTSNSDRVLIRFPSSEQFQPQEEYCFTVTASNETFTALIEGSFALDPSAGSSSMLGTVAIITVFVTIIAITLLGVVIIILVIVKKILTVRSSGEAQFVHQAITPRSLQAVNNEVELQGHTEASEQVIGIYSLLQSVGDETPESQTNPHDPIYVDIGPSTASQEDTTQFIVPSPSCDDKVEYAEVKQTEERKPNTNSEPVLLDRHLNLDNLLIQLQDDVTPRWYEFGVTVGVPKEIMDKCKDYPPDQCIVEVLDYWLVHYRGRLTWRDVADALKEIQLHCLADYIIKYSET